MSYGHDSMHIFKEDVQLNVKLRQK